MFEPQYVWMCASLCIHKKDSSRALSLASRFPSAPMCRLCLCAMNIEWQRVGHSNAHTFSLCIAFCLPDCLFPSHRFAENVSFFCWNALLSVYVYTFVCIQVQRSVASISMRDFQKKVKVIHFSVMRYLNEQIKYKWLMRLVFIHKHVCTDEH